MTLWLLLLGIGGVALVWSRGARRARLEWLRKLGLLGKWQLESGAAGAGDSATPPGRRSLTLSGALSSGAYVARDGDAVQRGEWRLNGHTLTLAASEGEGAGAGPQRFELRLFEAGRIGIDGPGREREIYVKQEDNVVPLVLPKGQR